MRKIKLSNWNNEIKRLDSETSILLELEINPMTVRDLCLKLNVDRASIQKRLYSLQKQGLVACDSSFPAIWSYKEPYCPTKLVGLAGVLYKMENYSHLGIIGMIRIPQQKSARKRWFNYHPEFKEVLELQKQYSSNYRK